MWWKTLTFHFPTDVVYYPFHYSLLSRDCQLHRMLMCFPDFCKLAIYSPPSHSSLCFHSGPWEDSMVGPLLIPEFLQSPRLIAQFSLAPFRSLGAFAIWSLLPPIQASFSLLRVWNPDPLSDAQKSKNLQEAEWAFPEPVGDCKEEKGMILIWQEKKRQLRPSVYFLNGVVCSVLNSEEHYEF